MKAWNLFVHSVRQVFGNLAAALRMTVLPAALVVTVGIWLSHSLPPHAAGAGNPTPVALHSFPFVPFLLLWLMAFVMPFWIAVGWHRYILRNEAPWAVLPRWHGGRVLAYIGRLLLLGLIIGIPTVILFAVLAGPLFGAMFTAHSFSLGMEVASAIVFAVLMLPAFWIFNRIAAVLPAAALGERLTIGAAWRMTADANATFVMLAVILLAAQLVLEFAMFEIGRIQMAPVVVVLSAVVYWVQSMVGISLLTTIYGHYIEKRPLVDSRV